MDNDTQNLSWLGFIASGLMIWLINVDFTAVNLALVYIAKDFYASLSGLQWVLTAYLIGFATLILPAANIADSYGHKKCFLLGIIIFITASIIASLSINTWMLILSRALQGTGAAFIWPAAMALAQLSFTPQKRALVSGFIVSIVGLGMACGPWVAAILLSYLNWQAIFFVNIPLGLLSFITMFICLKNKKETFGTVIENLDYIGLILLLTGLLSLFFSIDRIAVLGFTSPWSWGSLFVALIILTAFVYVQFRISFSLLPLKQLSHLPFASVLCIRKVIMFVFLSVLFILSPLLQISLDLSLWQTAFLYLPLTIMMIIIPPMIGRWLINMTPFPMISIGVLAIIIGLYFEFIFTQQESILLAIIGGIFLGIGFAISGSACGRAAQETAPQPIMGSATGIYYTLSIIAGALGITVSAAMLNYKILLKTKGSLSQLGIILPENKLLSIQHLFINVDIKNVIKNFSPKLAKILSSITHDIYLKITGQLFEFYMVFMIIGFIFMVIMLRIYFYFFDKENN